ncbi:MAG TPA: hypothetical protein VM265_10965 [Sphingomicrobium sp.]|nr:hypothetical protein [Sphingomicrobium sp.]
MPGKPIIALAAVLLAACGQERQAEQPAVQKIAVRGEAQEQLHQLDDLNRAIGLKRAIYASGSRCQRVVKSGFVQPYNNLDMWMAGCDDGREWAVFVGPDGSAQIRPCNEMQQLKLPACVIRGKEQAAP